MKTNSVGLLCATVLLSATMAQNAMAESGYWADGNGNPVHDGNGDCVHAANGNMLEGCGAEPPPEPEPEPVTPPPPPPPPPPKPVKAPPPPPPVVKVLTLNESAGSNFAFDSAKLNNSAKARLNGFANSVKASRVTPAKISVVGHTDSIGTEAYNQRLSVERARSVANYLSGQGFNRNIMSVSGRGESQPVASNKTKAGRAKNRRVEVTVSGQRRIVERR